jgi:hypothetical protein
MEQACEYEQDHEQDLDIKDQGSGSDLGSSVDRLGDRALAAPDSLFPN